MKNSLITLLSIIVVFSLCSTTSSVGQDERTVVIEDYRNKELPSSNDNLHSYKDIAVYRVSFVSNSEYAFFAYGIDKNNKVFQKGLMLLQLPDDFDKAHYIWESDTLANVQLINSLTKKEYKVQLSGNWLKEDGSITLSVVD